MDLFCLLLVLWHLHSVQSRCIDMNKRDEEPESPKVFLSFTPKDTSFTNDSIFTITCKGVASINDRYRYPQQLTMYDGEIYKIKRCPDRGVVKLGQRTKEKICIFNYTITAVGKRSIACSVRDGYGYCTTLRAKINIQEPKSPIFSEQPPRRINVSEGLDLNITCASYELPRPMITWYKDGNHVTDHIVTWYKGKSTLMLRSVIPSDKGRYWCEAENSLGKEISNGTNIAVLSQPQISINPVNQTVAIGTEVKITCSVTGHPLPIIGWTRDGEDLGTGTLQARDLSGSDDQFNLTANDTQSPSSAGVAIGNSITMTSRVTQLSVTFSIGTMVISTAGLANDMQSSPSFVALHVATLSRIPLSSSSTSVDGGNATASRDVLSSRFISAQNMTTTVSAFPSSGHTTVNTITPVLRDTTSQLKTNSTKTTSHGVMVSVFSNTTIRLPSRSTSFSGITKTKITRSILKTTSHAVIHDTVSVFSNTTILLPSKNTSFSEITQIKITPSLPKETSHARIHATVLPFSNNTKTLAIPLPLPSTITQNTTALNNTSINNKITPSTTTPSLLTTTTMVPPTRRSRQFSGAIKQDRRISTLFIKSVSKEDQAKYRCYATNGVGKANSSESNLHVFVNVKEKTKPRFEVVPRNVTVLLGISASLNCSATGNPVPNITWYKTNSLVTNRYRVSIATVGNISVLKITSISRDDVGMYTCLAQNGLGTISSSAYVDMKDDVEVSITGKEERRDNNTVVLWSLTGSVFGLFVIISIVVFIYVSRRRRRVKNPQNQETSLPMSSKFETAQKNSQSEEFLDDLVYFRSMGMDRDWALPRDRLQVTNEKLGSGCFGNVYLGVYTRNDGKEMNVAVKMLKDTVAAEDRNDILAELHILKQVGRHPNIVSLVGACTQNGPINIVIELVEGSNLHDLLRKSRTPLYYERRSEYENVRSSLTERDLVTITLDVAKGMQHLHMKECIHRDLAARNILIGKGLLAKISDFGLARNVPSNGLYVKTSEGKVPWKWMSPEALRGLFTNKSDIWSFGILLWEIVTLGETPYHNITQVLELYSFLVDGHRLEQPSQCDELLYSLMSVCWSAESKSRPGFKEIRSILQDILKQNERIYINLVAMEADENLEHSF